MNYFRRNTFFQLVTALILVLSVVDAKDNKKNSAGRYFGMSSLPTDYEEFNVNRWTIDTANDGRIMVNNVRGVGGEWANTGVFLVYAQSWWFAGQVDGELRVVGNEFSSDMEVGPYGGNPNDPSTRTYNVNKTMLGDPLNHLDFQEWPADQGAPWVDVDGDGVYTPLPAGTDHPEFVGDQVIWSIQNDGVQSRKAISSGLPTNVEVRTTMFAFDRPDAFGDIVFVKHAVLNPTSDDITDAYLGVWVDPDNGDYSKDLIGVLPDLSLGYCYNDGNDSEWEATDYGPGPVVGYDFFQGPAVPCDDPNDAVECPGAKQFGEVLPGMKNLGLSGYNLFINSDDVFGDPDEPDQFYFALQGLRSDGTQLTEDITGATCTPEEVAAGTCTNPYVNCEGVAAGGTCYSNFSFWGDPSINTDFDDDGTVTAAELALNPIDGYVRESSDRRFLQSVGPFTLAAGDEQEIVYGIIAAWSPVSSVASISALVQADQLAQLAYDIDFALPASPPTPTLTAYPSHESVMLAWNDTAISYSADSAVDLDANGNATTFEFEGYKLYQYANATKSGAKLFATYDIKNGITTIMDDVFDANYGVNVNVPVASGTDSGLTQNITVNYDYINNSSLENNNEYYYGVSAYGYNADGIPKMLESSTSLVSVRPSRNAMLDDSESTSAVAFSKVGLGDGNITVTVVDPSQVTGDDYAVTFDDLMPDGSAVVNWTLTNTTTGEVLVSNNTVQDGVDFATGTDYGSTYGKVQEGFKLSVGGPSPGHKGMYEIKEVDVPRYTEAIANGEVLDSSPSYGGLNSTGSFSLSYSKGVYESRQGYDSDGANVTSSSLYAPVWDNDPYEYMSTDDLVLDFSKTQVAWEYPYSNTPRLSNTTVPFAAYRSVNGVLEQMHVRYRDLDGDQEFSYDIDYKTVTAFAGYLRLANENLSKEELDALDANLAKEAAWYDVYSGPHYSDWGHEPFVIMGYTNEPYDPAKEADYLTYTDGIVGGACESLHDYWAYYYGNTTGQWCNSAVTVPSMTAWAEGGSLAATPSGSTDGMYYGVYAGPIIFTHYFSTSNPADAGSVYGEFDSQLPTAAGIQTARDGYGVWGYEAYAPTYTGAAAMVLINNKINTSNVTYTFSMADNVAEKKAFEPDNITVWPNPYYGAMAEEQNTYDQRVMFSNLPSEGQTTVRIFSVDGTLVRLLKHNDAGSQHLTWDLNNEYGLPVASGMYFAHVEARDTEKVLKLAIVQPEMRIDTY